jgi:hypothetical protein
LLLSSSAFKSFPLAPQLGQTKRSSLVYSVGAAGFNADNSVSAFSNMLTFSFNSFSFSVRASVNSLILDSFSAKSFFNSSLSLVNSAILGLKSSTSALNLLSSSSFNVTVFFRS